MRIKNRAALKPLSELIIERTIQLVARHMELSKDGKTQATDAAFVNRDETLAALRKAYDLIEHDMTTVIDKDYTGEIR